MLIRLLTLVSIGKYFSGPKKADFSGEDDGSEDKDEIEDSVELLVLSVLSAPIKKL